MKMSKRLFKSIISYIRENIEDASERADAAIDYGWKNHLMPSIADRSNLTTEIYDVMEDFAEENELDYDELCEIVADNIDDIFFNL